MRVYVKRPAPGQLRTWRHHEHTWEDFCQERTTYEAIKASLCTEQQYLCCYCENTVTLADAHIEHFCPRHGPHGDVRRTFEYANLGCSCSGGVGSDRHCGHYKGHHYDPLYFVNPCAKDAIDSFAYTIEGAIGAPANCEGSTSQRVAYMIRLLNLDCSLLTSLRRAHAHNLQDIIQSMIDVGAVDQIDDLALEYLMPNQEGQLFPFFSLSCQLLGAHAEFVLGLLES